MCKEEGKEEGLECALSAWGWKSVGQGKTEGNLPVQSYVVQFSSVAQLFTCPTLWEPMDCSMPGLPVHHQFLEFTQTHGHPVDDAIQPSHPLSSPSPPAFNLAQHQGLFK